MKVHLLTISWALLTAIALLAPEPNLERFEALPGGIDSAVHFVLFLGLAILLVHSLRATRWARPLAIALLLTMLYGLVLEIAQIGVEGRVFDWRDVLWNGLGALVGLAALRLAGRPARS